ncbi:MAG: Ig-like domain-containing protein [Rhodocyclales bacterium]|nr:Ig-like domain-containing protein [Rhodocyclales bacterium]
MGNSDARRRGVGLALLLAAGAAGAADFNSSLAPLITPNSPTQSPMVMVAEAAQAKKPSGAIRTLGVCKPMENSPDDPVLGKITVDFSGWAANYLFDYEKLNVSERGAKVTLLQPPTHGQLIGGDTYVPNRGFHGQDKIVAIVELGDYQVRVVYFIKVVNEDQRVGDDEASIKKYCSKTDWKISLSQTTLDIASLQPLIDYAGVGNTIDVQTGSLTGGAIGSTTGTIITLDTNAAGYNWFIDPTPTDNSEFLPTANPNEWIAKADSEAAGKMDMLSVLLHEYGHALGINHSSDPNDFMGTTLTPGVRRLPSAEELALMAQLAGEIKGDMTADSNTPDSPQSPLPSLPLGSVLGVALLGRLRSTRYGSWTNTIDSASLTPQYDTAANPIFTNSQLQSADGWSTTGNVAIGNGAAVLTETATSQTRLNQVFVVGEHDRFLSFTLANIVLDDQNAAPDDAFEAALLDANTGLSLLGDTGLTHNDAFLNLQADGSEHAASGITSIRNADGSRTYLVDLAGIPAGTAVNLSFDLLGFGQGAAATNSHLTIRDLRIGVPQTTDDSVTLAEDTPTTIAALANDLNAQQPGFAPVLVDAPAHGQVTINADGSFNFTPDKDWNGEDRFTYKLSDGHVDSEEKGPGSI